MSAPGNAPHLECPHCGAQAAIGSNRCPGCRAVITYGLSSMQTLLALSVILVAGWGAQQLGLLVSGGAGIVAMVGVLSAGSVFLAIILYGANKLFYRPDFMPVATAARVAPASRTTK